MFGIDASERASFDADQPHRVLLKGPRLGFRCEFSPSPITQPASLPDPQHWNGFWSRGGCIDLSGSTDPRAGELERRIVLSQYLTAIQCAGSLPPQETGLTCNSWYGKYHLEMHWWHAAHFPMWGRTPLLNGASPGTRRFCPSRAGKLGLRAMKERGGRR